jgi:hypothetical protein
MAFIGAFIFLDIKCSFYNNNKDVMSIYPTCVLIHIFVQHDPRSIANENRCYVDKRIEIGMVFSFRAIPAICISSLLLISSFSVFLPRTNRFLIFKWIMIKNCRHAKAKNWTIPPPLQYILFLLSQCVVAFIRRVLYIITNRVGLQTDFRSIVQRTKIHQLSVQLTLYWHHICRKTLFIVANNFSFNLKITYKEEISANTNCKKRNQLIFPTKL